MSIENLGAYGEFSKNAKQAGGVDIYLSDMRQAAFLQGAGLTLMVTSAVVLVTARVKKHRAEKRLKEETDESVGRTEG